MYVLNEEDYVRGILASKSKPSDLGMGYLITLIAKYYYSEEYDVADVVEIVKMRLREMNIPLYQEYKYHRKIQNVCSALYDGKISKDFRKREYIPIYKSEIETLNFLDNDRERKFMFTLFAVARYMECDGWINKKNFKGLSEVFRLANISVTSDKKSDLLHTLYTKGLIHFAKQINNLNIRVDLVEDGEIYYKIRDFKDLGNQYMANFKAGYRQCATEGCTGRVKITGPNSRYCKKCARERNLEKHIRYNKKR